jgi:DNA topoisomerase-1
VPEGTAPDELTLDRALELIRQGRVKERVLGELDGQPVVAKVGRYGPYVQLGEDGRSASLFPSMSVETVTLEEAVELLSLPRVVGVHPETGEEILAHNGRFGPYLSCGKETRSLDKHEEILTISLEEALARLKEPKRRGTRRASSVELGTDPETGAKVVLRSGRFGPYVSDGKVNATLPRGLQPSEVTLETALDLLGERKARLADDRAG